MVIRDRDNDNTGIYTLGVVYATPKCAAPALGCGQAVTGAITDPAEQQAYTLPGFAGEVIRLTSVPIAGGVGPDIDVFNAFGVRVGGFGYNDFSSTLTLTNTGNFRVIVRGRDNDDTGSYSLTLDVIGGCFRFSLGSAIVRTQQLACLPLQFSVGSPARSVAFTVQAPAGHFVNPVLQTGSRFTDATVTVGADAQWLIRLQTSSSNPLVGEEFVGSLYFTVISTNSAFVPITVADLVVTNNDGLLPSAAAFGNRVVVIADRPLLEATLGPNAQRVLTLYGKANTAFRISDTSDPALPLPWTPTLTNLVPTALFYSQSLTVGLSNAPVLFLHATEQ